MRLPGIVQAILIALLLAGAVAPTAARGEGVDVEALIVDAAERWNLPPQRLLCIAWRESGYRPYAVSPWGHVGIWQWDWRTWAWASERAGYGGASPFDPWASTEVAAWLMSEPGGWGHWPTSRWCP